MKTVFTRNAKQLNKEINEIGTTGKKLDLMIQAAAMACVFQSIKNRNIDPAKNLLDAMPKGSRVKALEGFLIANGQMANKVVNGAPVAGTIVFHDKGYAKLTDAMIEAMDDMPWWDFKHNDDKVTPFDFKKALAQQLKKAKAAHEDESDTEHAMTDVDYMSFVTFCKSMGVVL